MSHTSYRYTQISHQNTKASRKQQKRLERLQKEAETLEAEIDAITEELFGSAATDYLRAAELEAAKNEKEERLMEIYEEIGV